MRAFSEDESEGYLIDGNNRIINFQDITFNESNATTFQEINILGSQDWIDDGNQRFKIQISVLSTNIPDYFGKSVSICLENEDDDKAGIELNFGMSDENLLATSTSQDQTTFGIRLLSEPENSVSFSFELQIILLYPLIHFLSILSDGVYFKKLQLQIDQQFRPQIIWTLLSTQKILFIPISFHLQM